MAGKVSSIKSVASKPKSKRANTASAKSLKASASELAFAASPVQYLGVKKNASLRLSRLVAEGLSTDAAEILAGNLDLSPSDFTANYVLLPKQTLARRKAEGKLTTAESDRVVRFARLLKEATDMMEGDKAAATRWLKAPQVLLENQTPLEFARTESGALEVQQLIARSETGVYS